MLQLGRRLGLVDIVDRRRDDSRRDGRLVRFKEPTPGADWTAAPLLLLGPRVARYLDPLPGKPPHELTDVFQLAIDAGAAVCAIPIGRTRDITSPDDLVRENFPYLR